MFGQKGQDREILDVLVLRPVNREVLYKGEKILFLPQVKILIHYSISIPPLRRRDRLIRKDRCWQDPTRESPAVGLTGTVLVRKDRCWQGPTRETPGVGQKGHVLAGPNKRKDRCWSERTGAGQKGVVSRAQQEKGQMLV